MIITVQNLKKIAGIILNTFEQRGIKKIVFKGNFFWHINIDHIHDFTTDNPPLYVGSLVDDWDLLKGPFEEGDNDGWIGVDLWKIGNIFIEIYRILAGFEEGFEEISPTIIISLAEFGKLVKVVLDGIDRIWVSEVDCRAIDSYWKVVPEDRQNFSTITPRVAIGSLKQDWKKLCALLNGIREPEIADFERFGHVAIAFVHERDHV